jgi:hypothetical protein
LSSFSEVFLINAINAETITTDLKTIALTKTTGDSKNDALRWLSSDCSEWLLLLENADDPAVNLGNYFPRSSHGNILITGGNHNALFYAPQSNYNVSKTPLEDMKEELPSPVMPDDTGDFRSLITKVHCQWSRIITVLTLI